MKVDVDELKGLTDISLPEDVTTTGISQINKALSQIQANNSKATCLAVEAVLDLKDKKKKKSVLRTKYEVKRDMLLANDEDVKKGKNAAERDATVNGKLKEEIVDSEKAEIEYNDAQMILSAVEYVLSSQKATKELTGHQLNVIQKEIDLGLISPGDVAN